MDFDYFYAFSRNLGVVSREEQERLKAAKVGVAGLGAAGGASLHTLVRIGIGSFHIADIDDYEMINFNRQIGARISTVGKKKTHVMKEMVLDINPEAEVEVFDSGINEDTIDKFLDGVEVVVDGLDFFAFEARRLLYRKARDKGMPIVASAPLGFTTSCLVFLPDGMKWEDYFAFDLADTMEERALLFAIGCVPPLFPIRYLDLSSIRFAESRGPSIATAIQFCGGLNASEALKLILKRGKIYPVPYYHVFDTYFWEYRRGRLRKGNRDLLQRLRFYYAKKRLKLKGKR